MLISLLSLALTLRATTGVMIETWSPFSVRQTTAIAVAIKLPSWNWTILLNIPCKYKKNVRFLFGERSP